MCEREKEKAQLPIPRLRAGSYRRLYRSAPPFRNDFRRPYTSDLHEYYKIHDKTQIRHREFKNEIGRDFVHNFSDLNLKLSILNSQSSHKFFFFSRVYIIQKSCLLFPYFFHDL